MIPFMLEVLKQTKLICGRKKKSWVCFWRIEDEGKGHDGTFCGEDNVFDLNRSFVYRVLYICPAAKVHFTFH